MDASQKKRQKMRYNLHYRIRKQGYRLVTAKRTIYISYSQKSCSKQVDRLRNEFNYGIQLEII